MEIRNVPFCVISFCIIFLLPNLLSAHGLHKLPHNGSSADSQRQGRSIFFFFSLLLLFLWRQETVISSFLVHTYTQFLHPFLGFSNVRPLTKASTGHPKMGYSPPSISISSATPFIPIYLDLSIHPFIHLAAHPPCRRIFCAIADLINTFLIVVVVPVYTWLIIILRRTHCAQFRLSAPSIAPLALGKWLRRGLPTPELCFSIITRILCILLVVAPSTYTYLA